jgi:hypothetical protein
MISELAYVNKKSENNFFTMSVTLRNVWNRGPTYIFKNFNFFIIN